MFTVDDFGIDILHEGHMCDPTPQECANIANAKTQPLLDRLAKLEKACAVLQNALCFYALNDIHSREFDFKDNREKAREALTEVANNILRGEPDTLEGE